MREGRMANGFPAASRHLPSADNKKGGNKMKHILMICLVIFLAAAGCACNQEGASPGSTDRTRVEYVHVGPNWAAVYDLKASEKTFSVKVKSKQDETMKVGADLAIEVTSDKAGKVWVVQVDPEDKVTLLFPNERSKDNTIKANAPFSVPPNEATWHIEAGEPVGKSVVAFIVTAGDTDLQDVLGNKRSMTKALRLVENAPSWGLEKVVIDVKKK